MMTRDLRAAVPLSFLMLLLPTLARASDSDFVRMWEAAQRARPSVLSSTSRITGRDEPGQPLVVHGQILQSDGKPASNVIVFAYQTDASGVYAPKGDPGAPWRLKGWARTDASGRFEFSTIRPAPYPGHSIPAHIHLTAITDCCGRQFTDLMFEDDPLATPEYRLRFERAGEHGLYLPVRQEKGVQHVELTIKLRTRGDF
jgi:intradiol ring-cleaving dioxygenase-like protein